MSICSSILILDFVLSLSHPETKSRKVYGVLFLQTDNIAIWAWAFHALTYVTADIMQYTRFHLSSVFFDWQRQNSSIYITFFGSFPRYIFLINRIHSVRTHKRSGAGCVIFFLPVADNWSTEPALKWTGYGIMCVVECPVLLHSLMHILQNRSLYFSLNLQVVLCHHSVNYAN